MLVNDATYDGMAGASLAANVMGAPVRMVLLKHLLALKLHVLKQRKLHRFLDDFIDVTELVKSNRLDLQSAEFRDLFLRYGSTDLYDKVCRILNAGGAPRLARSHPGASRWTGLCASREPPCPQGVSRFLRFISAQAARTARLPPAASRGWLPSRVRSGASGACAGVLPGPIPRRTP